MTAENQLGLGAWADAGASPDMLPQPVDVRSGIGATSLNNSPTPAEDWKVEVEPPVSKEKFVPFGPDGKGVYFIGNQTREGNN